MPSPTISRRTSVEIPSTENKLSDATKQTLSPLSTAKPPSDSPSAHASQFPASKSATAKKLRKVLSDADISDKAFQESDVSVPVETYLEKIGEFEALHDAEIEKMLSEKHSLSDSLKSVKDDLQSLKDLQADRKKGAKARAIAREGAVRSLTQENTGLKEEIESLNSHILQYEASIQTLEDSLSTKEFHLTMRDSTLEEKSKFLSSRTKLIENMKSQIRATKENHQAEIDAKDREILNLQHAHTSVLANLQEELSSVRQEKSKLHQQVNALTSASSQFTPGKSQALNKTTKMIADEAETLKKLNTTLVSRLKDEEAKNAKNLDQIAQLRAALDRLCESIGIDPAQLNVGAVQGS